MRPNLANMQANKQFYRQDHKNRISQENVLTRTVFLAHSLGGALQNANLIFKRVQRSKRVFENRTVFSVSFSFSCTFVDDSKRETCCRLAANLVFLQRVNKEEPSEPCFCSGFDESVRTSFCCVFDFLQTSANLVFLQRVNKEKSPASRVFVVDSMNQCEPRSAVFFDFLQTSANLVFLQSNLRRAQCFCVWRLSHLFKRKPCFIMMN
jgi:hypothetical protein